MKLKRREVLMAAAAAAGTHPAPAQAPASGADLLDLARRTQRSNREALDQVKLPMAAEPAFHFKA
jgi:hypothetical protein